MLELDVKKDPPTYITAARLCTELGWSKTLVQRFLPEPDLTQPNPYYRRAAPTKLYLLEKVLSIETTPEFIQAKIERDKRGARGVAVANRKRAELLQSIEEMVIDVRFLIPHVLINSAINNFNNHARKRGHGYKSASLKSDTPFLERIQVNFIRHQLTRYDETLETIAGKIGVADAVTAIRVKIYNEIARVYPYLAQECCKQRFERTAI